MAIKHKKQGPKPLPRLNGSMAHVHELLKYHNQQPKNDSGRRGGLRFGQRVWNALGKKHLSWPELFYCEDTSKAYAMIAEEFGY